MCLSHFLSKLYLFSLKLFASGLSQMHTWTAKEEMAKQWCISKLKCQNRKAVNILQLSADILCLFLSCTLHLVTFMSLTGRVLHSMTFLKHKRETPTVRGTTVTGEAQMCEIQIKPCTLFTYGGWGWLCISIFQKKSPIVIFFIIHLLRKTLFGTSRWKIISHFHMHQYQINSYQFLFWQLSKAFRGQKGHKEVNWQKALPWFNAELVTVSCRRWNPSPSEFGQPASAKMQVEEILIAPHRQHCVARKAEG